MNSQIDDILDTQIEIIQISIYCDIVRNLLLNSKSISVAKIVPFSFVIKKRNYLHGSLYRGNNKSDLVLKFLSQVRGLFDELCEQMPYIFEAIDLLVQDGFCEIHEGELICCDVNQQRTEKYGAFTEAALQESKGYSDRQFLREVISIV
ncbi:hypothetical protein [Pusillibacter faecalis]|uniref:Uncharacterized protein n=1 Tax=Pusillibacter faecalis TaxID=2714358 RepID=A0A810QFH7_9FIRM|nr:hypothetical protein [Pusillibacter faecalis]BCK85325.1 hypothetical protein MM59RIKEN_26440 [Pusillibacter faecalis]